MSKESKQKPLNLIDGLIYHNFNEEPEFIGTFIKEKFDDSEKLIGYTFADDTGEEFILPASFSISKALDMVVSVEGHEKEAVRELPNPKLRIQFLGKFTKKDGQDFNRFKIDLLDFDKPPEEE